VTAHDTIRIAVIGSGYVDLVAAACFAEVGHSFVCMFDWEYVSEHDGRPADNPGKEEKCLNRPSHVSEYRADSRLGDATIPHLTRSGLHRYFQQYGIIRVTEIEGGNRQEILLPDTLASEGHLRTLPDCYNFATCLKAFAPSHPTNSTADAAKQAFFDVIYASIPLKIHATSGIKSSVTHTTPTKEHLLHKSETDPKLETAHRPAYARALSQLSRRTVLSGLSATMGLPLLPLSFLEGCGVGIVIPLPQGSTPPVPPPQPPQPVATVPQPVPTAVQTVATATISAAAGTLPDYFMGLSYEKGAFVTESLFTAANKSLAGMFNRLGNGILRIGGNSLDQTRWNPNGPGNTPGQVSPADIDNLAGFTALTNWKILYGVNLATSTPALAAAEVAYAQSKLSHALIGFEIGNEPEEYYLSYYPTGWNLTAFEILWQQFRSAILATTPSAIITGPDTGGNGSSGNVTAWSVPFTQRPTGKLISLLTQHYYRGNGHSSNATVKNLISPDANIITACATLKSAASARGIPFRISETNSYLYGGSPGVSDAYASALWVIDHLFNIAHGGASGVNMQGGDVGDYTPIANSGSTVLEARPEYYGLLLFSLSGQGTLLQTALSTSNFNATVYAVLTPSSDINVLIVNKEVYQSLNITIDCGRNIIDADLIELRGPSLTATTGQTLQGATVATDGSITLGTHYTPASVSGSKVTCYVPAISAVLLKLQIF
jgi:hypothetical protein